jgi:hypothetical protein
MIFAIPLKCLAEASVSTICAVAHDFSSFSLQTWSSCTDKTPGIYADLRELKPREAIGVFQKHALLTFSRSCRTSSTSTPAGSLSMRIFPPLHTTQSVNTLLVYPGTGHPTNLQSSQHEHHSYKHAHSGISVEPFRGCGLPYDRCRHDDTNIVDRISENMDEHRLHAQIVMSMRAKLGRM